MFLLQPCHSYAKCGWIVWNLIPMISKILMVNFKSYNNAHKNKGYKFLIISFQPHKAHNMLAMMLNSCYKSLGLVIQYVDKERALHIVNEYDRQVLFPLLVWAYKFLNPTHASERTPSFTFQSSQSTSLHDLMESNGDMVLWVMKEQLTHFKI